MTTVSKPRSSSTPREKKRVLQVSVIWSVVKSNRWIFFPLLNLKIKKEIQMRALQFFFLPLTCFSTSMAVPFKRGYKYFNPRGCRKWILTINKHCPCSPSIQDKVMQSPPLVPNLAGIQVAMYHSILCMHFSKFSPLDLEVPMCVNGQRTKNSRLKRKCILRDSV